MVVSGGIFNMYHCPFSLKTLSLSRLMSLMVSNGWKVGLSLVLSYQEYCLDIQVSLIRLVCLNYRFANNLFPSILANIKTFYWFL